MKESFTKANIFHLISNLDGYDKKEIEESGAAYKLKLYHSKKAVVVTWPYELGEVFLDYYQNDKVIYQDWFECMETDEINDFIQYIEAVTKRYLFNESRIKKVGIILKNNELQYLKGNVWHNVLHP